MTSTRQILAHRMREAARRLSEIGAGNPRLESEYLMAHAYGIDRIDLFRRDETAPIPEGTLERFDRLLGRRLGREPLQYVLGTAPFGDLDLAVGPGVLIPRSETELLVDLLAGMIGSSGGPQPSERPRPSRRPLLVDFGTGSGAILLGLLRRLPEWIGLGVDCSRAALDWARRNRERTGLRDRSFLALADSLSSLPAGSVRILVSNPPYIRTAELADLAPEIREYEPRVALDGGEDGLDPFRTLVPQAVGVLSGGGLFAVELAPDQPQPAGEILLSTGAFAAIEQFHDLAGRARGIIARRR